MVGKSYSLTRKQHNKLFPRRRVNPFFSYKYTVMEDSLELHKQVTWQGKLTFILVAPVLILLDGLPTYWNCLKDALTPDYTFDADYLSKSSPLFNDFMLLAKEVKN